MRYTRQASLRVAPTRDQPVEDLVANIANDAERHLRYGGGSEDVPKPGVAISNLAEGAAGSTWRGPRLAYG